LSTAADPAGPGEGAAPAGAPRLLRTAVVGSYSVPEWLGRVKTDFHLGRASPELLGEINEMAIKAALIDQLHAGIDVVSDGEYRRDNDMDHFVERLPGVALTGPPKTYYFDYLEAAARSRLPEPDDFGGFGLVDHLAFMQGLTDHEVTVSMPGPFSLSRRIANEAYPDEGALVQALARLLGAEARRLEAAGATRLQIDEPFLAGYPEAVRVAIAGLNTLTEGITARVALHVCYGNRYARPAWEGHYDFLFPTVLGAHVDELVLEFARKGLDDLALFRPEPERFVVGCGVIDVKSREVESAETVAGRLRQALRTVPPEQLAVNPDCGLRHLPVAVARAKLEAMVKGAAIVRAELGGAETAPEEPLPHRVGILGGEPS